MKKLLGLLGIVALLSACGAEQIDAGNRGIETWFGKVTSTEPVSEGLYFYFPIGGNIIEYECKTQKYTLKLDTYTKDVQPADLEVTINYALDGNKIIELHKTVGQEYKSKVLDPKVMSAIKNVVGQWDAASLVANREKASQQILEQLRTYVSDSHINISSVSLNNINYSDSFEKAIESKVVAKQKAEEAVNRTVEVEEESKQTVLKAKADAESMEIRSNALAKNKGLVEYEAVQRWDGKLPVNMYGSAPLPFINIQK